jgi:putative transposase
LSTSASRADHGHPNHAAAAAHAFATDYGAKPPKAVAKITDDLDELLAFYDYPAEHWIHLRTTNPVQLRHRQAPTAVTKGPGSRAPVSRWHSS